MHRECTLRYLNEQIREADGTEVTVENCCGQRYIGSGLSGKHIHIAGTPGNALGAYLNGAVIEVRGNGQDAVGDTMNEGSIIIHGSSGDATGYAMRGGNIFVEKDAGYRAGIHMKAFKDKQPAIVIGGRAGCFLGEYQAGGHNCRPRPGLRGRGIPRGQLLRDGNARRKNGDPGGVSPRKTSGAGSCLLCGGRG